MQNVLPILGPDDLAKVPLREADGTNLRLDDVANVKWDSQPLIGDAVINDGPGLLLVVQKFPNANTLEVTRGVEEAIDDMRPGLPGMEIDTTIFRPATFIELALDHLTKALLLGVLLVVLILAAFLFEWRTAFISLIAIPLSLLAAVLVLQLARRHHQRDDPGGAHRRHRGRRRRRDHRRGEHRAKIAPESERGHRQVDLRHRAGGIG